MSRRSSSSGSRKWLTNDESWGGTLIAGLAELIGSAILVFVGCMGCVGSVTETPPHLQVSLTFGFAIASIIHIIGHISHSHINPLVSICSVILGARPIAAASVYIFAHFLGAIIGYGLLRVAIPTELLHTGNPSTNGSFCVNSVNEKISPYNGLVIEAAASAVLIIFVCACLDPRNTCKDSDSKAIKFGLLVSMLVMAAGPYTGCSLNPARSFAPALWNNVWTNHWVYWVGPISGAVIVSFAYKVIFWPKKSLEEEIDEAIGLNSIETEKPEQK